MIQSHAAADAVNVAWMGRAAQWDSPDDCVRPSNAAVKTESMDNSAVIRKHPLQMQGMFDHAPLLGGSAWEILNLQNGIA